MAGNDKLPLFESLQKWKHVHNYTVSLYQVSVLGSAPQDLYVWWKIQKYIYVSTCQFYFFACDMAYFLFQFYCVCMPHISHLSAKELYRCKIIEIIRIEITSNINYIRCLRIRYYFPSCPWRKNVKCMHIKNPEDKAK
jgi:hypothetical protein